MIREFNRIGMKRIPRQSAILNILEEIGYKELDHALMFVIDCIAPFSRSVYPERAENDV